MRRIVLAMLALVSMLVLWQCNRTNKSKLPGVWKLQQMEINGTRLQGNSLGDWMWEFNAEGGYLSDIAGAKEKGLYQLNGNTLTIKALQPGKWPDRVLIITKLDSTELRLEANGEKNKSTMRFLKISAVMEKD